MPRTTFYCRHDQCQTGGSEALETYNVREIEKIGRQGADKYWFLDVADPKVVLFEVPLSKAVELCNKE